MTYILIALALALVGGIILLYLASENGWMFAGMFGLAGAGGATIGLMIYAVLVFDWIASEYKVGIINREYSTDYTREEVFYASSVIDTIRELNRSRYELNGDLMRNGDKELLLPESK